MLVDRALRGDLGVLLGGRMGRSQTAAPAACFHRQHRRSGKVLQHRDTLVDRNPRRCWAIGIRISPYHDDGDNWPRHCRTADRDRARDRGGRAGALFSAVRQAGAADHHAVVARLAHSLVARGDLSVWDRQRPRDLHGGRGTVLSYGTRNDQPDRRGRTQSDQRRPHHGRQ